MKWAIDPGLEGDVYADEPYLYGVAGSSFNVLRVGGKVGEEGMLGEGEEGEEGIDEGAEGDGGEVRREKGMPEGAAERKKWFLREGGEWVWEGGRVYRADFFNPYLDFNSGFLSLSCPRAMGAVGRSGVWWADDGLWGGRFRAEVTGVFVGAYGLSWGGGLSQVCGSCT